MCVMKTYFRVLPKATFLSCLILSLCVAACIPQAEDLGHKRRIKGVRTENRDHQFTYNEFGKIKSIRTYRPTFDNTRDLRRRITNTYDSKGYLVGRLIEDFESADDVVYWRETFAYKSGRLVNGYYRRIDPGPDSVTAGYRNHEVVLDKNGIEEYANTTFLSDGVYFRVKRGLSAEGNVEWQEKAFETSPDMVSERQDITYDVRQNPFYGIGFYDPFDMRQSNSRNMLKKRTTGELRNTQVEKYSYEYLGRYPTSRRTDTYNSSGELLFSSTEYYRY